MLRFDTRFALLSVRNLRINSVMIAVQTIRALRYPASVIP